MEPSDSMRNLSGRLTCLIKGQSTSRPFSARLCPSAMRAPPSILLWIGPKPPKFSWSLNESQPRLSIRQAAPHRLILASEIRQEISSLRHLRGGNGWKRQIPRKNTILRLCRTQASATIGHRISVLVRWEVNAAMMSLHGLRAALARTNHESDLERT